MEFFPLAAVGVGLAVVGTVLLLFFVMLFRTRLSSANNRTTRTTPATNNANNHPLEKPKPNSLMLTSTTITSNNSSSATNINNSNSAGYRPLPTSNKAETDGSNPDIIPGANGNGKNFSAGKKHSQLNKLNHKKTCTTTINGPVVAENTVE
jgi:hypothetical protein